MSIVVKFFVNQLDELIKQQYSGIDIYNLPVDPINVKGNVTPLFQTYDEASGSHTILKICSEKNNISYLKLQFGDGGVIIGRTDETKDFNSLMFKTPEGWSKL